MESKGGVEHEELYVAVGQSQDVIEDHADDGLPAQPLVPALDDPPGEPLEHLHLLPVCHLPEIPDQGHVVGRDEFVERDEGGEVALAEVGSHAGRA